MQHFFISILLGVILSCNNLESNNQNTKIAPAPADTAITSDSNTLVGEWELIPVLSSDTAAGKLPWINFDVNSGTFTGNTGCNTMSGSFVKNGYALSFNENVNLTKIACEGYNEQVFLNNLLKTNIYRIEDGTLMLMFNQTVMSKWARKVNISPYKKA